jgi:hypothetical protein
MVGKFAVRNETSTGGRFRVQLKKRRSFASGAAELNGPRTGAANLSFFADGKAKKKIRRNDFNNW